MALNISILHICAGAFRKRCDEKLSRRPSSVFTLLLKPQISHQKQVFITSDNKFHLSGQQFMKMKIYTTDILQIHIYVPTHQYPYLFQYMKLKQSLIMTRLLSVQVWERILICPVIKELSRNNKDGNFIKQILCILKQI